MCNCTLQASTRHVSARIVASTANMVEERKPKWFTLILDNTHGAGDKHEAVSHTQTTSMCASAKDFGEILSTMRTSRTKIYQHRAKGVCRWKACVTNGQLYFTEVRKQDDKWGESICGRSADFFSESTDQGTCHAGLHVSNVRMNYRVSQNTNLAPSWSHSTSNTSTLWANSLHTNHQRTSNVASWACANAGQTGQTRHTLLSVATKNVSRRYVSSASKMCTCRTHSF